MKVCVKCQIEKDNSEFGSRTNTKDKLHTWCKSCWNTYCKAHRKPSVGRYKEYGRKYYHENKESRNQANRQWQKSVKGQYMSYMRGARARNISWNLSPEEFQSFWKQPCFYCNSEIKTIGLDRLNSKEGYDISNIRTCCTKCNQMKSNSSLDEFLKQIEKIYNHMLNN
jgi:hypothetical protein